MLNIEVIFLTINLVLKKKNYQRLKKINSVPIVFVFYLYKKEQLKK